MKLTQRDSERGFTLIELMIVVAIIGILAAIAIPLYANMADRANLAKAQADLRTLASAVTLYSAHMGALPATLDVLTVPALSPSNQTAGPFLTSVPNPPQGWAAYRYTPNPDNTFVISTSHPKAGTVSIP